MTQNEAKATRTTEVAWARETAWVREPVQNGERKPGEKGFTRSVPPLIGVPPYLSLQLTCRPAILKTTITTTFTTNSSLKIRIDRHLGIFQTPTGSAPWNPRCRAGPHRHPGGAQPRASGAKGDPGEPKGDEEAEGEVDGGDFWEWGGGGLEGGREGKPRTSSDVPTSPCILVGRLELNHLACVCVVAVILSVLGVWARGIELTGAPSDQREPTRAVGYYDQGESRESLTVDRDSSPRRDGSRRRNGIAGSMPKDKGVETRRELEAD